MLQQSHKSGCMVEETPGSKKGKHSYRLKEKLGAEQVYTDMLYKIVEAPTKIHMRVSARMLVPAIDQKLRDAETEG